MLFVSIFTSDRTRDPELWATIWQGNPPPSINLIGAYNLANNMRIFIWEGESVADTQYMDRLNEIGLLETYPAFDRTGGWQLAFAKDIDTFRARMEERVNREGLQVTSVASVDSAIDLRTRGLNAPNRDAARAAARQWVAEQEAGG